MSTIINSGMVNDLLSRRVSVREFSCQEVQDDILAGILEAGRLSPSGGNEQPWLFGVIRDKQQIIKIADLAYNQKWITTAPLLITLCSKIYDKTKGGRGIQLKRFPDLKEQIINIKDGLYASLNSEEHQTKIAGTHMMLCALEYGIYSTWVSCFNVSKLTKLLNLPDSCIASEVIALGYPLEIPKPQPKKSIEEIVFYERYFKK